MDAKEFSIKINDNNPHAFCVIHVELDEAGEPVDWTFVYCNEKLAVLEGKSKEELLGKRFYQDLFPNGKKDWLKPYYEAAYLGRASEFEESSPEIGLYLSIKVFPTGDNGYCAVVLRDIREEVFQKAKLAEKLAETIRQLEYERSLDKQRIDQAQRNIQQAEENYERLHKLIKSGMWKVYYNSEYRITSVVWSQEFRQMLGYTSEVDFPDNIMSWARLLHPEDRKVAMYTIMPFLKDMEAKSQYDVEYRLLTKDRGYRWYRAIGTVTRRADGSPYCFWGTFFDVTAKHVNRELELENSRTMKKLTEAQEAMDMLHKSIGSGAWYFSYNGANELINVRWSPAFRRILGYESKDEFIDSAEELRLRTHPEDRERVNRCYRAALEDPTDKTKCDVEFRCLTKDRGYRWFRTTACFKRRLDGTVKTAFGIFIDIDDKRNMDEQLCEAFEKADKANRAKTEFLRHMSHDIRTPLNGITGLLALGDLHPDDVELLAEQRKKAKVAVKYLLSLVNSVLDISKLEDGSRDKEECAFDLEELLVEDVDVIKEQMMELNLTYKGGRDCIHIEHSHLIGNKAYLNHILMNLAGNAVKFNRKNGSVTMTAEELSCDGDVAVFRFICADTGMGMSQEFQKRMFEPFAQEGKVTYTSYMGSGLGLSFVKTMVDQLGGTLECESQEGVGTKFTITLSFKVDKSYEERCAQKAAAESLIKEADLNGLKILVVEDNDLNMEIANMLLSHEGAQVDEAVNGQEAVEKFAASEPGYYDIIFMDIMMPVMNGLEATKQIRAMSRPDARDITIIAMSANAFQDDVDQCLAVGMDAHCAKPFEISRVKKTVWQLQQAR